MRIGIRIGKWCFLVDYTGEILLRTSYRGKFTEPVDVVVH